MRYNCRLNMYLYIYVYMLGSNKSEFVRFSFSRFGHAILIHKKEINGTRELWKTDDKRETIW